MIKLPDNRIFKSAVDENGEKVRGPLGWPYAVWVILALMGSVGGYNVIITDQEVSIVETIDAPE